MSDENFDINDLDVAGDEDTYDVITLVNEDTEEDYFVIDGVESKNTRYLLLVRVEDFDNDEPEAFIFKEVAVDSDNCTYEPVEDEAEYKKIMILLENEDSGYTIEV